MAHDETIRIYRSDALGAEPPSLTYGELAANLTDRKLFIGGPGGTANMMVIRETPINTGVTSFNGATGAVVYAPPVASAGASGVASFSSTDFTVSGTGHVSFQGSLFTLRDEIGGSDSISKGETLTITGGTGIDFVRTSKNNFAIRGVTATSSVLGVASFPASFFSVSNGAVSLSGPYAIIGVTGVSAGHTGIALSSTTGNVQIWNMGVHTFNGSTGHITFNPVTGDTVSAGLAIGVSVVSGNNKRIDNLGVTSFNGLTGAVTLTGDSGAIIGASNNTITARLATSGATGVASFPASFFSVSNGAVSLSGPYGVIGVTGIGFGSNDAGLTGKVNLTSGTSITFDLLANNTIRINSTGVVGATGDTVTAGVGMSVVRSGNQVTVNNMGVTSFNGITGAVTLTGDGGAIIGASNNTIRARLATESLTGVASFPATFFAVNNGAVSLSGPYAIIGVTGVTAGPGISLSGITGNVRISNTGVTSFNGTIGAVVYAPPLATAGASGVASFLSRDFSVSNTGHVSLFANWIDINTGDGISILGGGRVELGQAVTIRNIGVTAFNGSTGNINLTDFVQGEWIATRSQGNKTIFTNIGVTGISAGHTGIALIGTTGNVRIFNMGVHTFNGATGHITFNPATGDTVSAGLAIGVSVVSGNNKRIDNLGVTSFNGLTGAVTLTGDSGAIIGASNNVIRARLATESLTGVASFPATFFAVNNGAVSLSGPYGIIGVTGVTTGPGISVSGTTGNVRISNMGVTSFNGLTGAVTLTGDSGAIVGAGNNTITARIATSGATGVASFPASFFSVSNGAVSLSGPYSIIGVTGIGFGNDAGLTGKVNLTSGTSITFDLLANNTIRINSTGVVGATGDTVVAGVGTSVVRSGNQVTVNNMGVTSFNGLTGAVTLTGDGGAIIGATNNTIRARLATESLTGVASFPATFFAVNNGAVSLSGPYGIIGVTGISAGHTGISLIGTTGNVRIFNMGVHTFNGATGHITFNPATGDTITAGLAIGVSVVSGNNKRIDNLGVTSFNGLTGAATLTGDSGAIVGASNNVIRARLATESLTGVASFPATFFAVNNGAVSLSGPYAIIGVTGVSAGHTGISLVGTTGNVRIFNMGVHTFNGATGHITFNPATGDTITAGLAIGVSVVSGNNKRIDNLGVTSFNGLTGAVTLTGDGGAVIGAGNNRIIARLVTSGTTGIASFNTDHFSVSSSTGHVSLASAYTATGDTVITVPGSGIGISTNGRTDTLFNIGVTGISAGHTGIALSGTTGNVQIWNMGVLSLDGQTGHLSRGATGDTVVAGVGVSVVRSGNQVTVNNMGVTSFNGLTGAVVGVSSVNGFASGVTFNAGTGLTLNSSSGSLTFANLWGAIDTALKQENKVIVAGAGTQPHQYASIQELIGAYVFRVNGLTGNVSITGDGGAIVGVNNNTIRARLAVGGATGVASFNSGDFDVSNTGHVSVRRRTLLNLDDVDDTLIDDGKFLVYNGSVFEFKTVSDIYSPPVGVTSFNGITGAVTLTGDGGAIVGTGNNRIIARLVTSGTTGIASFNTTHFSVSSSTGHVSLASAYTATGDTITSGLAIGVSVISGNNKRIDNLGVTSFNGLTGAVTLTGDSGAIVGASNNTITARLATSGATGVASFPTTDFGVVNGAVSLTGNVARTNVASTFTPTQTFSGGIIVSAGATFGNITATNVVSSLNGLTGARTLTGDGGAIIGASNNIIRARLANETTDPPAAGTTGVAAFFQDHFIVTDSGLVKLLGGGGGGGPGPLGFPTSGMGASFAGDNSLSFAYVDFGNLATGSAIDTVDQLVFFDDSATSVVKTRKISVKNFFQDNTISDIFSTATPGQLARTKDGNVLQWSVVTSNIGVGQEGLVKGATAFAYIAQNTVKSINGQTGDVGCIAVTCAAQTFTGLQTFITGISTANLTVSGGATFGNISASNIVNSLNGLTGARTLTGDGGAIIGSSNTTIGARLATTGVTGVASYNPFHFDVVNGEVSLDPTYQATGDTVSVGSPLTLSRAQNSVTLGINAAGYGASGVASFNSVNFDVSATGHVTLVGSLFTFRDEIGGSDSISKGETLTITGGQGVDFLRTGKNNYAIRGATATTGIPGVASFVSTDFSVSSTGHVSLSNVAKTNAANTFTGLQTFNVGITASGATFTGTINPIQGVESGYTRIEWAGLTSTFDIIPSNWATISAPINSSPTQNDAYFAPIFITKRVRIKTIGTQTGANGASNTGNILLGLYDSDSYGYPRDRLYTSGSIALTTASFSVQRATNVDIIVNPGQYWLAIVFSASSIPVAGLGRLGTIMKYITPTSSSPIGQASVDGLRRAQGSFTLATSQSGTFTTVTGSDNPAIFYTAEVV